MNYIDRKDPPSSFVDAIRGAGMEPPDQIEPGRIHRFPGAGKKKGAAGWCVLLSDGQGGAFGDWSRNMKWTWHPRLKNLSLAERERIRKQRAEAIERVESERMKAQQEAAVLAHTIWNAATPTIKHPYLERKRIQSHGSRLFKGRLLLPINDFTNKLSSLQFIDDDGSKKLLKGGRKRGCYIQVSGDTARPDRVIICEGWATGCTLAEEEPASLVLSAIDSGNLEPVAVSARCRWPSAELVIAGDDDRLAPGNPGATKAMAAAISADALLALPQWPPDAPKVLTDFNDLAQWLAEVGYEI